jgi:hypothetical protein
MILGCWRRFWTEKRVIAKQKGKLDEAGTRLAGNGYVESGLSHSTKKAKQVMETQYRE